MRVAILVATFVLGLAGAARAEPLLLGSAELDRVVAAGKGARIPAAFVGVYAGIFEGDSEGSWRVDINRRGRVKGTAGSPYLEPFKVSGRVDPEGAVVLKGRGKASIGGTWRGQIYPNGTFSGDWIYREVYGTLTGTFSGRKISG